MINFSNGSDWVLKEAIHIDLHTTTHDPTRAGSYLQLPDEIRSSNCVVNIRNDDNLCGLWCIIAHLFPKFRTGGHRIANTKAYKQHMEEVNTGDVQFPLRIRDIGQLERLNTLNINVFTLNNKNRIIPLRISEKKDVPKERVIDLLYVVNGLNTHYSLITNIGGKSLI
jgi:hypothetical protein